MWCEAGFDPATFLQQTAATFAASLRGAAKQRERQVDRDLWLAWHTGAFAGAAFNGNLKGLDAYRGGRKDNGQSAKEMLGALRMLQDMGAPMTIKQIN